MLVVIAAGVVAVAIIPTWRSNERDAFALGRIAVVRAHGSHRAKLPPARPSDNSYSHLRATGGAAKVIAAARHQLGMPYVLGVGPRHRWSLDAVGDGVDPLGFDCSALVAYAVLRGAGIWISGNVAHTDEIWTQGGKLPLTPTTGRTGRVFRGMGSAPPPGGYQPGDILFRREGAGGYWGHVLLVSERGYVIEALPPDVHETKTMTEVLADGAALGWMRVRGLEPSAL